MLYNKRTIVMAICSVSILTTSIPVYADTMGSINITANIKVENFKSEIYVVVADEKGENKLAILSKDNGYKYTLTNLNAGKYDVKDVRIINNENKNEYTLKLGNLDLNEKNQSSNIAVDINPLKAKEENKSIGNNITSPSEDKKIDQKDQEDIEETKERLNKIIGKDKKEISGRQKYMYLNLFLDLALIIGLGSIWFFKIRKKNKDEKEDE